MAEIKLKTKLITDAKELDKAITSVITRGKKWENDVHQCAMSIIAHTEKTGDYTKANTLFNGMPRSSKRKHLAEWFLAFGKVKLNEDEKTKKESPFVFAKEKETDLEGGDEQPWYSFAKEDDVEEAYDFQAELKRLLARASKRTLKEGQEDLLSKVSEFVA